MFHLKKLFPIIFIIFYAGNCLPGEALRRDPKRGTAAAFFSAALSEEVGRVASEGGTERAVEAFSESLGFPLREAACRYEDFLLKMGNQRLFFTSSKGG